MSGVVSFCKQIKIEISIFWRCFVNTVGTNVGVQNSGDGEEYEGKW